jgi:hypothetical protein
MALDLCLIALARRDDAKPCAAACVDDHEYAVFDAAQNLVSMFAVIKAVVALDQPLRIEKNPHCVSEVEATLDKTGITFRLIPFEPHRVNVGQRTTHANNNGLAEM